MLILKRKFLEPKNFVFLQNISVTINLYILAIQKLGIQWVEHISYDKRINNILAFISLK